MNTIIIPTTQNIELEYPIATLGDRILATLLDLLVRLGYVLIVWWIVEMTETKLDTAGTIILGLPIFFYHLVSEVFMNGQSLGKRALKTRVIRLDGDPPTLSDYLLRWSMRIVDFIPVFYGIIGLIAVAASKKGQRLGDLVAGTTVIKLKLVTHFADTIFVDTEQDYQMQFPEIKNLSDRDVSILKEVLDIGLKSQDRKLLRKLSNKVKEVARISTKLGDRTFLETILSDYNHYYGRNK